MGRNLFVRSLFQTSFDISVQDRHAFKLDQAWTLAELLLTGLQPPREARPPCCILGKEGGLPLLKCVLKYDIWAKRMVAPRASLCQWMPSSGQSSWYLTASMAEMPQYVKDLIGSLFILLFSFGYKEFKVGREYMIKVFNGFINAWFDYWFWQVSTSYDYADIWEWNLFFGFFVLPFFQKKHRIKTKSRSKRPFH
jgi:hypothetical protein